MSIKLVENYNLWWPDFEDPPKEGLVRMFKRLNDCDVVAGFARTKGICVQAGGHVGLWARQLAKQFALVHTFEPVPSTFACLRRNTVYDQTIVAHDCALGAEVAMVAIAPRSGGRSKVLESTSSSNIRQVTIDSLELPRCDLIYLDMERYELQALDGAVETIANYRPVICVEVLDGEREHVEAWMRLKKYKFSQQIHSDWVFVP